MSTKRKSRENKPPRWAVFGRYGGVRTAKVLLTSVDWRGRFGTDERVYSYALHPTKGWRRHRER